MKASNTYSTGLSPRRGWHVYQTRNHDVLRAFGFGEVNHNAARYHAQRLNEKETRQ